MHFDAYIGMNYYLTQFKITNWTQLIYANDIIFTV